MLLAHALWRVIPEGATGNDASFTAAVAYADREVEPECEAIWRSLDIGERKTLKAIAEGHTTTIPQETQQNLDLPRQTSNDARKRLIGSGHLYKDTQDRYLFTDPLFQRWVNNLGSI